MGKKIDLVLNLTTETADKMGYEWWKDVIFDVDSPADAKKDIFALEKMGYVFGDCATIDGKTNNFVGVYKKKTSH